MRILAFDTSTEYLSVALWQDGEVTLRETYALQSHCALILPHIQEMLTQEQCQLADLNAVAFGAGPGSFTGLRIACGVAQGLAYAHQLPVVPVCTLQALAAQSRFERVIACLDARMGEVYIAAYHNQGKDDCREILPPSLCAPDEAPALTGQDWVGVGTGWQVYAQALSQSYPQQLAPTSVDDSVVYPSAATIAQLALAKIQQGLTVQPEHASPIYVRNKVALTTQEREQKLG